MKKYSGMISVIFLVIGLISLYILAPVVDFIGTQIYLIAIMVFIVALIFAFLFERGLWRKISFGSLISIILIVILWYGLMMILWDEP